jgi:hypothetical protein
MTKRVDIVRVNNPVGYAPNQHHAVEEERTENLLYECHTQREAEDWALRCGFTVNVHRERNRRSTDKHGQFREP